MASGETGSARPKDRGVQWPTTIASFIVGTASSRYTSPERLGHPSTPTRSSDSGFWNRNRFVNPVGHKTWYKAVLSGLAHPPKRIDKDVH